MDSPQGNSIIHFASSPETQVSPFFNFMSNLSPIRSLEAAGYYQRFSQVNLPIPLPVFTSPHLDVQRHNNLLRDESSVAGSDAYGQSNTQLKSQFPPCSQKEVSSHSPSGCIDQYLSDPVQEDNTMSSSDLLEKEDDDMARSPNSGFTSHREKIAKADIASAGAKPVVFMSNQTEESLPSIFEATVEEGKTDRFTELLTAFLSGNVDDHVESDSPVFGPQQHQQFLPQSSSDQHHKVGATSQLFPESLHRDEESDCNQHAIRRHLHFGATVTSKHTGYGTHAAANLGLTDSQKEFGSLVPSYVKAMGTFGSLQAGICAQAATLQSSFIQSESVRIVQNCRTHAISTSIPSDGDLHLNSMVRSVSVGSDSSTSKQQEEKLMLDRDHNLGRDLDSIPVLSASGGIYTHMGDEQQESQAALAAGSSSCRSINVTQSPCDSLHLMPFEQQAAPCEGTITYSGNVELVELIQENSERNGKRAKYTTERESCKRCTCKRSRCLKLYCECFASGIYCLDSCSCENCFNKPEYEDTVLDTRQQIEARNPLAFAPKVVKHPTDSPIYMMEEGNQTTPSSSRHKRGCNCKKSKCVKKYCECYQAGVGCSKGCRCEGCCNAYGKKAETSYRRAERWKNQSQEQKDHLNNQSDCVNRSSFTWADIGHLTPPSDPPLGAVASSASFNMKHSSKISRDQSQKESSPLLLSGYLSWCRSPCSLTPELYRSEALPKRGSDKFLYDISEEDDTPEMLKNTCTPTKAVKNCSPNQKRVSSPRIHSHKLRSSSSRGMRSVRKFILQDLPSFPPLTPYSKSEDGVHQ